MTSDLSVVVEPLTTEWIESVVDIHLEAYRSQPNFTQHLGRAFVRRTYAWFSDALPHRFGFVALVNGVPIGFVVGGPYGLERQLNHHRIPTAAHQVLLRPWRFVSRPVLEGLADRVLRRPRQRPVWTICFSEAEVLSLYSLATLPEFARLRISTMLLRQCDNYAAAMRKRFILTRIGVQNLSSLMVHRVAGYTVDPIRSGEVEKYLYKEVSTR